MSLHSRGQATIEYLFLLAFVITLTVKMVSGFSNFMGSTVTNLGHVLTYTLSTGVCSEECFYPGHRNGRTQ